MPSKWWSLITKRYLPTHINSDTKHTVFSRFVLYVWSLDRLSFVHVLVFMKEAVAKIMWDKNSKYWNSLCSDCTKDYYRNPPPFIWTDICERCAWSFDGMLCRIHYLNLVRGQRHQWEGSQEDYCMRACWKGITRFGIRWLHSRCSGCRRRAQGSAEGTDFLLPRGMALSERNWPDAGALLF